MSIFINAHAICSQCDTRTELKLAASVNADRRPDLRDQILDGSFQATLCPGCGAQLRLPLHLSYLDLPRGQWILAESAEQLPEWRSVETSAQALFNSTYGIQAPKVAQQLGAGLRPRLVFGWAALRETLICDDLALDPIALELLKIAMIRNIPDPPLGDATELRLTGGDGSNLRFAWVDAATEQELAALEVGQDLLEDIVANQAAWTALRTDLEGVLFLDLKRLIFA